MSGGGKRRIIAFMSWAEQTLHRFFQGHRGFGLPPFAIDDALLRVGVCGSLHAGRRPLQHGDTFPGCSDPCGCGGVRGGCRHNGAPSL